MCIDFKREKRLHLSILFFYSFALSNLFFHAFKNPGSFPKSVKFSLLRGWNEYDTGIGPPYFENIHGIVNCRYIYSLPLDSSNHTLLSSIFSIWNLQTLYVKNNLRDEVATFEIWKMSQLRHFCIDQLMNLLDPPPSDNTTTEGDNFLLGNLQTLLVVHNFKFSENVVRRIPNIKELEVCYYEIDDLSNCCLNNLVQLINLEFLGFYVGEPIPSEFLLENLSFPHSLKELTLFGTRLDWGDMGTKIGSLPHLQALILKEDSCVGAEWETVDGQFRSLKYLELFDLYDLICWRTESWTHFPCLEHLSLQTVIWLKEIPSEIGETLKSIEMWRCSDSTVFSANEILKEQKSLGNEGLQVKVILAENNSRLESLAAPDFQVITCEQISSKCLTLLCNFLLTCAFTETIIDLMKSEFSVL